MKSIILQNKTHKPFKVIILSFFALTFALWIGWLTVDSLFVTKGIYILETLGSGAPVWNATWSKAAEIVGIILLSMFGVCFGLEIAYAISNGLTIKEQKEKSITELCLHFVVAVIMLGCVIKSAEMMVNKKYILDATFNEQTILGVTVYIPATFNLYHMDFGKLMCVPAGLVGFGFLAILLSFKPFNTKNVILNLNIIIIVFGFLLLAMTPGVLYACQAHTEELALLDNFEPYYNDFWLHIAAQLITIPMGVFAGMVLVLTFARIVIALFVPELSYKQNKVHFATLCAFEAAVLIGFITAHVWALDIEKLWNNEIVIGTTILVSAQTLVCLLPTVYCIMSIIDKSDAKLTSLRKAIM